MSHVSKSTWPLDPWLHFAARFGGAVLPFPLFWHLVADEGLLALSAHGHLDRRQHALEQRRQLLDVLQRIALPFLPARTHAGLRLAKWACLASLFTSAHALGQVFGQLPGEETGFSPRIVSGVNSHRRFRNGVQSGVGWVGGGVGGGGELGVADQGFPAQWGAGPGAAGLEVFLHVVNKRLAVVWCQAVEANTVHLKHIAQNQH